MKRAIFIFSILLSFNVYASVQKGIVRTAGRANHQGKEISDVIIRAEGAQNAVASQADGTFSIRFHDIKEGGVFRLNSVKKANYEVLDKGLVGRSLAFSSSVPMTIVLLDKNEMEKERQEMTSRFEKTYAANYNKRVKEIEEQYSNQVISLEQKIEALEETDNLYEKIQSQMNEMVDHYVRTDYDVLDSLDKEINHLIELGEFEKAKEKILSKGNINERVQTILDLQKQVAHNEQSIKKLQQQQAKLANQVNVNQENLLKDLKNLYDIAITNYQIDSAFVLINHMLAIAPDDLETLREAAWYNINWRASYLTALRYCQKYLSVAQAQYSDSNEYVVRGYNIVAHAYRMNYATDSALMMYHMVVDKLIRYNNDTTFNGWLFSVYRSIASAHEREYEYDSALYYYHKAYEELELHPQGNMAEQYAYKSYSYAWLYKGMKRYNEAFEFNADAIRRYTELQDSNYVAECYRQQSYIYSNIDSLDLSLHALRTALTFISNIKTNRDFSFLNNIYSNICDIFIDKQQNDSALVYVNKVLNNINNRYTTHYKAYIAHRLSRAKIYIALKNYEAALNDYNSAINDMMRYHYDDPVWVGLCYRDRGEFYEEIGETNKALLDYETAIEYYKQDPSSPSWRIDDIQKRIQRLQNNKDTEKAENP